MNRAVKAIKNGGSIKRAFEQFNIPRTTPWDKFMQGPIKSRTSW